ncbi:TPM domain-containing protein [Hymenobacter latericus]|uniref:TPM domain-containing protein n=1 Tax=Hymenobacter sp. YIM 151858-1 TaxID=2987688 RepID=UPI002225C789|nr:TPM domain-containing protein [Hymenobacter sp. YIM 151858-1]UYZ58242.1 TPM domain-containing protein [Hymenobacter sp. YIM 151858-1]
MYRLLLICLLVVAGWSRPLLAAAADELPPRPNPFKFVTDQAQLLSPADANTLERGLHRYADNTGTQIVVVTVPTLGGRPVADYARDLGEAWGIGQRTQNNGVVVLLAGQERQVSIQAGSGLRQQITPELTQRIIGQQMTPEFKQGRYFAGLRAGLNQLMLAANPESAPRREQPDAAAAPGSTAPLSSNPGLGADAGAGSGSLQTPAPSYGDEPFSPGSQPAAAPASPGLGIGSMLLGALVLGGGVWLLLRLFRRKQAPPAAQGPVPDFYPNRPAGPSGGYGTGGGYGATGGYNQAGNYGRAPMQQPAPDFYPNRGSGGLSSGMGGALLTGAAAAAGAYLGNRIASAHDHPDHPAANDLGTGGTPPLPTAPAAGAAGGFAALDGAGGPNDLGPDAPAPDYFSNEALQDNSADYFANDDASTYDDLSSDDTGGGGFDDTNDNSGSW